MGGKREQKNCFEIKMDIFPPTVDVKNIKSCTYPINVPDGCSTFASVYSLEGAVNDEDTQRSGNADNTLTIVVVGENGETQTYMNIPANSAFLQTINLSLGVNTITLTATDRSGQTSQPYTYYLKRTEFSGQKIQLISPDLGVSKTKVFDIIVKTYMPAECKISYNQNPAFVSMTPMVPVEDNQHQYPKVSLAQYP